MGYNYYQPQLVSLLDFWTLNSIITFLGGSFQTSHDFRVQQPPYLLPRWNNLKGNPVNLLAEATQT